MSAAVLPSSSFIVARSLNTRIKAHGRSHEDVSLCAVGEQESRDLPVLVDGSDLRSSHQQGGSGGFRSSTWSGVMPLRFCILMFALARIKMSTTDAYPRLPNNHLSVHARRGSHVLHGRQVERSVPCLTASVDVHLKLLLEKSAGT